jgi:type II secretory ATPase GspE/PulE/Tfp pilus assembly ATPase PilB-like protein
MLRPLLMVAGAAALVLLDTAVAWAAEGEGGASAWPALNFSRGTGAYLSSWKILGCWVMFLLWVRTTDWVNQDAQQLKMKYAMWNPIVFFSFLLALVLFWLLPSFVAGIVLMFIAWAVPLGLYIRQRNQVAGTYEKVLTLSHIKQWLGKRLSVIGIKLEGADIDPRDMGPDIKLAPMGGADEATNKVNLLTARQSSGWMPTRELLDDALRQRATHVMLDYTAEATNIRYQIDGAWLDRAPVERAVGDPMLEVLKGLAALNVKDRRKRQAGMLGMEAEKRKYTCNLTSQGTQTGERALLQFVSKKAEFSSLEELGMRPKMVEQLDALLDQNGVFVFSSMPSGGLTTTMDLVISHADRFVRSFVTVADEATQDREIENVPVTTYSGAAGETPSTVLPRLIRTYPDVIIVRDVPDLETLTTLCEQVEQSRMVMISVRAREAVEALLRVLTLKIPPADFAGVVSGVLNVRLIRKLCETCKEAYPPPPQVLKQLGLPAGRIENLYRPPSGPIDPKHPEVVCETCNGIGYFGRTAIFELLTIDDDLRQVLATTPKLDVLRAAARKAKHRTLQDEGVLLVAKGITSIQELARVLKQ